MDFNNINITKSLRNFIFNAKQNAAKHIIYGYTVTF